MLEITEDIWVRTKHKIRKAYALTEKSFENVHLVDVICMVMPTNQMSDITFPEPSFVSGLQLGYQVLAKVGGQLVTTTGYWDEAVQMDQNELDADAMYRVSQWVTALRILGGKDGNKN